MSVPGLIACIRIIDARWRRNRATVVIMNLVPRPWSSVMLLAVLALLPASAFAGLTPEEVKAFQGYKVKAEKGDPLAQRALAMAYRGGNGVVQDYAESAKWLRKSAEQGDILSQYGTGNNYERGTGVTKDLVESLRWYRMAADQGNAGAQFNVGNCYYNGWGVTRNYAEGVKWYRKSAVEGNVIVSGRSLYCLGFCYANGQGVTKDLVEAYAYYRLAGATVAEAREGLLDLGSNLTADQLAAAKKRTLELQKEIDAKSAAKKAGK